MAFIPKLVVYQFLRRIEDAEYLLTTMRSFYDECLAYRNWEYVRLNESEIQLPANSIARGIHFKKGEIIDRWDFHCIDKAVPFVYGELLWSDSLGTQTKADLVLMHESLAAHLAQNGAAIVVGLQHSKRMQPNYKASGVSLLERVIFNKFYWLGSDIDLYLYQGHFRELVDLSRNPKVSAISRIDFYELREQLLSSMSGQRNQVIRQCDIAVFAKDFGKKLETRIGIEGMNAFRARTRVCREKEIEYSYGS
jgi:hypothetical protein